jgi:zinc protease
MPIINRKKAPAVKLVEFLKSIEPRYIQLSNGLPVYLIDEGIQEVLRIELVFKAGNYYQKQKQLAKATNTLLASGTSKYSADVISEHFDFYGAYLETSNDKDNAYLGLYTLNKHLENTLPMLAELIMDPVFPESELDLFRSTRKQHLEVNQQKVKYLARVHFHEQVFGANHPYGMRLQAQHLDDLKREDLVEHHHNHYRAEECFVVVSGKIPAGFDQLLDKYLGGFKSSGNQAPDGIIDPVSPSNDRSQFIQKKDALQAAIRIGKPTINRLHPDYPALFIVNTILGGYFGSRLMINIREDKGYTYGIGSALVSLQHSGLFLITSEVGNHVLKAATDEIYKEILTLCEEKVSARELSLVKNYLMGSLMRSLDGPFAVAQRLRSALEFGQTLDYYKNYAATIQNITPERIQALANEYLQTATLYQTIAGKKGN